MVIVAPIAQLAARLAAAAPAGPVVVMIGRIFAGIASQVPSLPLPSSATQSR
jgi:hypothetical protein